MSDEECSDPDTSNIQSVAELKTLLGSHFKEKYGPKEEQPKKRELPHRTKRGKPADRFGSWMEGSIDETGSGNNTTTEMSSSGGQPRRDKPGRTAVRNLVRSFEGGGQTPNIPIPGGGGGGDNSSRSLHNRSSPGGGEQYGGESSAPVIPGGGNGGVQQQQQPQHMEQEELMEVVVDSRIEQPSQSMVSQEGNGRGAMRIEDIKHAGNQKQPSPDMGITQSNHSINPTNSFLTDCQVNQMRGAYVPPQQGTPFMPPFTSTPVRPPPPQSGYPPSQPTVLFPSTPAGNNPPSVPPKKNGTFSQGGGGPTWPGGTLHQPPPQPPPVAQPQLNVNYGPPIIIQHQNQQPPTATNIAQPQPPPNSQQQYHRQSQYGMPSYSTQPAASYQWWDPSLLPPIIQQPVFPQQFCPPYPVIPPRGKQPATVIPPRGNMPLGNPQQSSEPQQQPFTAPSLGNPHLPAQPQQQSHSPSLGNPPQSSEPQQQSQQQQPLQQCRMQRTCTPQLQQPQESASHNAQPPPVLEQKHHQQQLQHPQMPPLPPNKPCGEQSNGRQQPQHSSYQWHRQQQQHDPQQQPHQHAPLISKQMRKFIFLPPTYLQKSEGINYAYHMQQQQQSSSSNSTTECLSGWTLNGPTGWSGGPGILNHVFVCQHEADSEILQKLVKESFTLESVGISKYPSSRSKEDEAAESIMERVTRRVGERWETGLLWREEPGAEKKKPNSTKQVTGVSHRSASGVIPNGGFQVRGDAAHVQVPLCEGNAFACSAILPVKHEHPTASPGIPALPSSYSTAFRRLLGVDKRLKRNPDLRKAMKEKLQHYVNMGYARKLTKSEASISTPKQWFLPIFPVFNPNKPGKLRIVFDAACQSYGKSLNDHLLTGPDLLVSLPGLLLNFRLRKIAITGDITEMFHQVQIRPEDQPAQRFLWKEEGEDEPDIYQLQVMMFGAACSPYCAQFVKNKNALEFIDQFPEAVRAITVKHYMDDYIDSIDGVEETIKIVREISQIHARGGFHISKWLSNSTAVLETVKPEDRVAAAKDLSAWSEIPTERALGLNWDPKEDQLLFKLNLERAGEGIASGEKVPTKRAILRIIMLIWDPLGFLNNFVIIAKIILQQLWRSQVGWDDEIPLEIFEKWKSWTRHLPKIADLIIPRCYSHHITSSPEVQLHLFADASEQAYCAIAYLRISTSGEIQTSFVMSKCRVAPLKPASIPRLELQAALIAARMGKFIVETLEVPFHSVHYWTDSTTVLKWIRSEARRFQQFVSNRIGEIHEITSADQWRWVPTKQNVADDGTRDGKCNISTSSRWWSGPDFLKLDAEEWPVEEVQIYEDDMEKAEMEWRKEFVNVISSEIKPDFSFLPEINRFSSYIRLVRSTACVLKACEMFRSKEKANKIMLPMIKAEMHLIKRSQWEEYAEEMTLLNNNKPIPKSSCLYELSPILDHDGIMRMRSRLTSAKEEGIRMPIILHQKCQLTKMLINYQHHISMHQGEEFVRNELRQRFWIPCIRTAIRGVIRNCGFCKIRKLKSAAPIMGNLPDFRIQPQSRPFTIVGMDYFGPYLVAVKRSQVKVYGVIFTCLTTRAVHLEIASDLSTDSCIMAIRRMIARRGQPKTIWSDNGTNLRGADTELKKSIQQLNESKLQHELSVKGVHWKFIPPGSPHFGATWERLVRSVKTALSAVLKTRTPKEEVLHTLFTEVEAILNSRPLTEVPTDPDAPEALTPFHFLIGTSSTIQPPGVFDDKDLLLSKRWRQAQAMTEMFWARWRKEYIPTLQKRTKWHETQPNVREGEVVILFDESLKNLRRGTWPLGIVTKVIPGDDGVVRVVEVRTATGEYRRPVVKLGRLGLGGTSEKVGVENVVNSHRGSGAEGEQVKQIKGGCGNGEPDHQQNEYKRD